MMLTRMIIGGQGLSLSSFEFTVTTDAQWDTVMALSSAELAGSTITVSGSNLTRRVIKDRDMSAFGGVLTIRCADENSSLPSIELIGTVRGIDFAGVNFQMTGWPRTSTACVSLGTGTFGKLRFIEGTTFRHGYGPSHLDFDTAADLPEYVRIDNVATASTTSSTHLLSWQDPAAPTGWIEFFNRGSETVHVAIGGANVTATPGDAQVAPGERHRISSLDPDVDTHFAVISQSNVSEVNARTEIGLSEYLANAFQQTGGAVLEDFELRNCLFRDLSNAVKGLRPSISGLVMDCDFDRIYQDIIALAPLPGSSLQILRNIECLPFARSGIAEHLMGDARDPHGDQFQTFNNVAGTVGPIFYAGNRVRLTQRRTGIRNQGIFVSDNDFDPSYTGLYFISTMQIGGSGRAISLGEENTSFKVRDAYVYGATVVDGSDLASDLPFILIDHDDDGTVYVSKSIAPEFRVTDAPWQVEGNLELPGAVDRNAVFPNFENLTSAMDRTTIEAALLTGAEGVGIGAVATSGTLNWETDEPDQVILWQNLPSGAHWNALTNQAAGELIVLPMRRIMNQRPAQPVVPGPSTEWRSIAADGLSEIQAWTSTVGTIEPGQFIQIRRGSAATGSSTVVASVNINGFEQSVQITTEAAAAVFLEQGNPIGYFQDTANVPSGTSRITFKGKFYFPGSVPNNAKPFAQISTGCDLILQGDGSINTTIEDGTGTKMLTNAEIVPPGTIQPDTWYDIEFDVNQPTNEVYIGINGVGQTRDFAASGNGLFQSNRAVLFLAGANGNTPLPTGTRIADLSVDFNGSQHKAISNIADDANVDPWHRGGAF